MGHFIPLNLTTFAIFSPARSNMNSPKWLPARVGVKESLTVRVKGATSFAYKAVGSGPCFIQGGPAG